MTLVEGSGLYCYNREDDGNSVVGQASCRMDVTRLEQRAYSGLWKLWGIILNVYEYENGTFKLFVGVVISDK